MTETHKAALVKPDRSAIEARDLHPLVELAYAAGGSNLDPAHLERLMDLQERHEATQAKKAFSRAMVKLKEHLPHIIGHDGEVDYTDSKGRQVFYTHSTLAGVADAVVPALCNYGFSHNFFPKTGQGGVQVTCRILHSEGHSEEATMHGAPDTTGGKNPVQGIASTVTYLSRYLLCSLLGIATKDMRDPEGGEEAEDNIDPRRNALAVAALEQAGLSLRDGEQYVQQPVQKWTKADRGRIRELIEKRSDDWGTNGPEDR